MDQDLQSAGVVHESEMATRLGLAGIPVAAETAMIDRDLRLVELTGARYHIAKFLLPTVLRRCAPPKSAACLFHVAYRPPI